MEADANKSKQTWKCCTDFFLTEVDTREQLPQTHVSESWALWSRSSQENVAFVVSCGNWNENFGPKVKLSLIASYNLANESVPK